VKDCDDGSDLCYADEDGPLANNPRLLLLLTRVSELWPAGQIRPAKTFFQ